MFIYIQARWCCQHGSNWQGGSWASFHPPPSLERRRVSTITMTKKDSCEIKKSRVHNICPVWYILFNRSRNPDIPCQIGSRHLQPMTCTSATAQRLVKCAHCLWAASQQLNFVCALPTVRILAFKLATKVEAADASIVCFYLLQISFSSWPDVLLLHWHLARNSLELRCLALTDCRSVPITRSES